MAMIDPGFCSRQSIPAAVRLLRGRVMKSKVLVAVSAIAIGLMGVMGDAEAAQGRKKLLATGAVGGVVAGAAGAYLINKMSNRGASAQEAERPTGSVRRATPVASDDDDDEEDERPVRKSRPRGVDQTTTGSVSSRNSESCNVRKVDLFDRKGNFVKNERMRVCN